MVTRTLQYLILRCFLALQDLLVLRVLGHQALLVHDLHVQDLEVTNGLSLQGLYHEELLLHDRLIDLDGFNLELLNALLQRLLKAVYVLGCVIVCLRECNIERPLEEDELLRDLPVLLLDAGDLALLQTRQQTRDDIYFIPLGWQLLGNAVD